MVFFKNVLFPLFYVIREFHRLLHRGKAIRSHPMLHVKAVRKYFFSHVYVVMTYLLSELILENNISVFPTFQSVDEIMSSDHSNENRTMWY